MGTALSRMVKGRYSLVAAVLVSLLATAFCDCPAEKCDQEACANLGEKCHCSGNETGIPLAERPMIVYLTFDDAFTALAEEQFYHSMFDGTYKNPNECDIRATHFITQSYTDYSLVNRYWHLGHEMAAHSITHRQDQDYWKHLDTAGWEDEMVGVRKMIGQFASIPPCQVSGNRAPFLQGGGDAMYQMLSENNFEYDCSWPTRHYGYLDAEAGLFPYTMDYQTVQDCPIEPCPTCSYPGLWVQPMIDLEDEWIGSNPMYPDNGNLCAMLDGCVILDDFTKEHVFQMLMKNWERVYHGEEDDFGDWYDSTRAPWGLYMHAAWFFGDYYWHYEGYRMFLDEITNKEKYPDVWIVPVKAGIDYMRNPLSHQQLMDLGKSDDSPFGCQSIEDKTGIYDAKQNRCGNAQSCKFQVDEPDEKPPISGERYMTICGYKANGERQSCPPEDRYPWLGDHCGGNTPCADCGDVM